MKCNGISRLVRSRLFIAIALVVIAGIILFFSLYTFFFSYYFCTAVIDIGIKKSFTSTNWTLKVVDGPCYEEISISQWPSPVIVKYANGSIGLQMPLANFTSGHWYNGVQFNNFGNISRLEPGDYFIIDRSLYADGSKFIITGLVGVSLDSD
ncbi:MAG: hypothetical protein OEV21_00365 [Thermoplasmata archaeon]|nr:hypothetical protein [Thermoplasmata archaeon]